MDFNDMINDQQYIQALDSIIEDKTIMQRVLFANADWTNCFTNVINSTNWVRVYTIDGCSPLTITIGIKSEKDGTPMQIVSMICQSICQTLWAPKPGELTELTDFAKSIIAAKREGHPDMDYIAGYNWLGRYLGDPSSLAPMFSIFPLMDNVYQIRF